MRAGHQTDVQGSTPASPAGPDWRRRLLLGGGLLVVLVVAYFILAATIPRWWAQRVASMVNGHLSAGLVLGLLLGLTCTLLPLLIGWVGLRRRRSWKVNSAWLALALLVAVPNLWTLSVVLGGGSAAHAGQRTMDVNAPWFRGASLVGALIGAAVFAGVVWYARRRRAPKTEAGR